MRISQRRLVVLALAVLKEAASACGPAPMTPSLALRFALRFLWAHSTGPQLPYDDFLKAIQNPWSDTMSEDDRRYCRVTYAGSALKGIIRSVGMPATSDFDHLLASLAGTKEDRDRYRTSQGFRTAMDEKRRHDEWKRRGRECDLRG